MEENVWSASASCCNRSPIFPRKIGDVHIWLSLDFFHSRYHINTFQLASQRYFLVFATKYRKPVNHLADRLPRYLIF